MPASAHPTLQSIVPLGAVPRQVRASASSVLNGWGYVWRDVTFAGTALLPPSRSWQADNRETWVIAVRAAPIDVGDELESSEGRVAGVQASGYAGGVIPVIPYQVHVFESLGRRGGGPTPEHPPAPKKTPELGRSSQASRVR